MQTDNMNAAYALGRMESWLEEYAKQKGIELSEFKAEVARLLMNGDTHTTQRDVVRKIRGPYKIKLAGPRGWGNMTAEERSKEMIHRQRVAKGLEAPRVKVRKSKRPMGGVA
jgi:hypothetical protein